MTACAAVLKTVTNKIWAAGQSTGGTMSLIAAATQACFAGAVSLAPFCSLEQILRDNAEAQVHIGIALRPASGKRPSGCRCAQRVREA